MTELLYLSDSYLRSFEAEVVARRADGVMLDGTAFYPGGGGQPSDTGTLSQGGQAWRVEKLQREGNDIWHILKGEPLSLASKMVGQLDWPRRYKLMRTHTALHILCGVIFREFGVLVTGCQMYQDRARMDFALEDLASQRIAFIERRVNEIVAEAHSVRIYTLPRQEALQIPDLIRTKISLLPKHIREVRIVEIEGLDMQADGGTHVRNTQEVGALSIIKAENKGRINKRLTIALDQ